MGLTEVYQVRPSGYPDHPGYEDFRLSTNDYLSPPILLNFCLYFPLSDDEIRPDIVDGLRLGLEKTLGQYRSLLGTIERNTHGNFSILAKQTSTVGFAVHSFDDADGNPQLPSFAELERAQFTSTSVRDQALLCAGITLSMPATTQSPPVLAIQANFLSGGLALTIHFHHWALDFVGFGAFVHQWAENTRAVLCGTPLPEWDPACLDRSRLSSQGHTGDGEAAEKNARPISAAKSRTVQQPVSHLLFHLQKSKAQRLKTLAEKENGTQISSYDAFTAMWWRLLTRHRARTYSNLDINSPAPFFEAVNMRSRLTPPLPARYLGNALFLAASSSQPQDMQLTFKEVMHDAPLWKIAAYVRRIADSVDSASFYRALEAAAKTPHEQEARGPLRSRGRPLLSLKTTDWRTPNLYEADFGFGRPRALRHLFLGAARAGAANMYIYPIRELEDGEEVFEFAVPIEKETVERFCADEEVTEWFDFVGVEVEA
ncbi:acyl transferase [Coniochaeta sp. PMI_546]|nr:acyl transferase [Coniochaeta sp. PMI_546]